MKKILALLLIVAATMSGCMKKDLDDIRKRLTQLEDWQKSVNDDIATLQSLVAAIEDNDFVTGVTALADGSGYVITFVKSGAVTIKHGTNASAGATPKLGATLHADGKHYWTVKYGDEPADWLLDEGGNMIRTTGEHGTDGTSAISPQLRIDSTTNLWEISVDGGNSWTPTSVKATGDKGEQGDAVFAKDGVDNSNANYVELTLADGTTKIRLPRYKVFKIGTDAGNGVIRVTSTNGTLLPLSLPAGFTEKDYVSIMAEVKNNMGSDIDIVSRSSSPMRSVTVGKPTFDAEGTCNNDAYVTVTRPNPARDGEQAILEVTIVANDGSKMTATRILEYSDYRIGDYYPDGDNPQTAIGMVIYLDYGNRSGKIMSLDAPAKQLRWWETNPAPYLIGAESDSDGHTNTSNMMTSTGANFAYNCPAAAWCVAHNTPATPTEISWYMPAIHEVMYIYQAWNGSEIPPAGGDNRAIINERLIAAGGAELNTGTYFSSSEINDNYINSIDFSLYGRIDYSHKLSYSRAIRAVSAFGEYKR